MTKDLLLIVDGGADDVAMLLTLLGTPDVNVKGIVCNYGNNSAKDCAALMGQILTLAGRTDIPVVLGANEALAQDWKPFGEGEGDGAYEGINGIQFPNDAPAPLDVSGVDFIVQNLQQAYDDNNKLTIMISSPHTVLAQAFKQVNTQNPYLFGAIDNLYSMGGCFSPIMRKSSHDNLPDNMMKTGEFMAASGNVTWFAEFNVYMDPEGWQQAMTYADQYKIPTYLLGLDSVNGPNNRASSGFEMTAERLKRAEETLPHGAELAKIFNTAAPLDSAKLGTNGAIMYDPLLAIALTEPHIFYPTPVDVAVRNMGTARGQIITADFANSSIYALRHNPNADMLFDKMISRIGSALRRNP